MCASHEPLGDRLNILLSSTNRVRFIQKRQLVNQQQMTQHLAHLAHRIRTQKHQEDKLDRVQDGVSTQREGREAQSFSKISTSRQKFKISRGLGRYAQQTTQEDSSMTRINQDSEESSAFTKSHPVLLASRGRTAHERLREVAEEKAANYRQMKEREQEMAMLIKLKSEQHQRRMKERVARAAQRKQEGRRKMEENYFEHIESVQAEKGKEKERKSRMTQKRMEEMMRLQLQEKTHIEQFESSLVLEQHLKSYLQDQLPISNNTTAHYKQLLLP